MQVKSLDSADSLPKLGTLTEVFYNIVLHCLPYFSASLPTPLPSLSLCRMTQQGYPSVRILLILQSGSNCAAVSHLSGWPWCLPWLMPLGYPTIISQSLHLYCIVNCLFNFFMFLCFLSYCKFPEIKEFYPVPRLGPIVEQNFKSFMSLPTSCAQLCRQ